MRQFSRYHIFCRIVDLGSFTAAANELGYTQSAVSQIVRSLETELGVSLLERRRDGVRLTADGEQYLPFLRNLSAAECSLQEKQQEMEGLERSTILIDTFTSVSRNMLPPLMRAFKEQYPGVQFVLRQGDYESIREDIINGVVDLGFLSTGKSAVSPEPPASEQPSELPSESKQPSESEPLSGAPDSGSAVPLPLEGLEAQKLYDDDMVAVLPPGHPLTEKQRVSMQDLAGETFILLDEGVKYNTALDGFQRAGLKPSIDYEVYDDYSIISMVRQGMGVSLLFRRVVHGFSEGVEVRELSRQLTRSVCLAWKNRETLPVAARRFADHILTHIQDLPRG